MYNINDIVILIGLALILIAMLIYVLPSKPETIETISDDDVNNFFFGSAPYPALSPMPPAWGEMNFEKNLKNPKKVTKKPINKTVKKPVNKKSKTSVNKIVKIAKKK